MRTARGYLIMALAFAALLLGGCAVNQTKQSMTQQWAQSCVAYEGVQKAVITNLPRLNAKQLEQVLIVTHQITPLCSRVPDDPTTATQQITKAVTMLSIYAAVQGVKK